MATVTGTRRLLDISGNNISTAVSLEAEGTLLDSNGQSGTSNQVLISTATGVDWVDGSGSGIIGGPYLPLAGGTMTGTNGVLMPDNFKLNLGTGNDFQLYHDGTHGVLNNTTGNLYTSAQGSMMFRTSLNVTALTLDASQNAVFYGNVGIGTTNPSEKLEVNGSVKVSNAYPRIYLADTQGVPRTFSIGTSNEDLIINSGSTDVLSILGASGNVGIGTTSPDAPLTVTNNAVSSYIINVNMADDVDGGGFYEATGGMELYLKDTSGTGQVKLTSSGSSYLNGGNVGIGAIPRTISTYKVLDISGSGGAGGYIGLSSGSTQQGELYSHSGGVDLVAIGAKSTRFFTNAVERMRINSSGNVGIGTTSPNSGMKLEVVGNIRTNVSNGKGFAITGTTGVTSGLVRSDGTGVALRTSDTDRVTVDLNGNVGIGTTSPSRPLSVYRSTAGSAANFLHYTDATAFAGLYIDVDNVNNIVELNASGDTASTMAFQTGNAERMRITTTGNVGIGTTSPGHKLSVIGGHIQTDGNVYTNVIRDNTGGNVSIQDNGGNVGIGTTSPARKLEVDFTGSVFGARFTRSDATGSSTIEFANSAGVKSIIGYDAGVDGYKIGTTSATNFVVKQAGNVGIGTTSPGTKLEVISAANEEGIAIKDSSGNLKYKIRQFGGNSYSTFWDSTNTEKVRITSGGSSFFNGGNVGIGTTSPERALDIVAGNGSQFRVSSTTANNTLKNAYHQVRHYNNSEQDFVWALAQSNSSVNNLHLGGSSSLGNAATSIAFFTASNNTTTTGSQRMTISNAGNVGIGTTSPGSKLEVSSGVGANGDSILTISADTDNSTSSSSPKLLMLQKGSTKTSLIEMDSSNRTHFSNGDGHYFSGGNVGIGTTSPSYKLDVNGVVRGDRFFVGTNTAASQWAFHARNNNSTADSGLYFNNNSSEIYLRNSSNVIGARIRSNSASYFNGGDVGIGTASPQERLHVSGETHPSIKLSSSSDGNYNVILNCGYRNEALNLSVGGYKVFTTEGFNTPETTHLYSNNSKALSLASNQAATFTSTVTATNFINSSDKRLKENIEEVRDNNVEVNWKTFNFKTEKEQKRYGVIAQELEKTNPEFVREDSQGFKSVAYIDLLIAKIAELEARIQKLEK